MILKGKKITFGITGSICNIKKVIPQIQNLINEGADIIPIMSFHYAGESELQEEMDKIEKITNRKIIYTIKNIDKLVKSENADIMVIAPFSDSNIAKLANGIMDTAILVAVKMHFKNEKSIVIGIEATEGLGIEAENIGKLLNMKKIYFIPFRQDNPITKPNSLRYSNQYLLDSVKKALEGEQIQPILI